MKKTTGFEEKQLIISQKIDSELSTLPKVFHEYIEHLKNSGKALSTVHSYFTTLTACLRTINRNYYMSDEEFYKKIEKSDISYYFDAKNNLGIQALQRHWSVLNSFFDFLFEKNYINKSPMDGIKRPIDCNSGRNSRNITYLNRAEVDRLVLAITHNTTSFKSFRDEVLIKLALSTGISLTEIVNINVEHIDFNHNTIRIVKKDEKLVPISPSMAALLKEWIQFRNQYFKGEETPALFISNLKNRVSIYTVDQIIKTHCEAADLPIITYKDLKSTMVYLLGLEGVSMAAIMDMLSITDYEMIVQAYDEAMKEKNVNILNALDNLFEKPISNHSNSDDTASSLRNIGVEIKSPEYSKFTGGGEGFTIYGNITNKTEKPIKLKLKSCAVFISGMLRVSDYTYSGYQFDEELIVPNTTRTFGKIWITDKFIQKELKSGDYLMLCLIDVDSKLIYYIKYTYTENSSGDFWVEENWFETSNK